MFDWIETTKNRSLELCVQEKTAEPTGMLGVHIERVNLRVN